MSRDLVYYLSPSSPYCYLGGARLAEIVAETGCNLDLRVLDMSRVLPATGGLPVGKRHPARLAYRLVELARWRAHNGLSAMNIEPRFFPVNADLAGRVIIARRQAAGDVAALTLANDVAVAVWERELDIADESVLDAIAGELGLDGPALRGAADGAAVAEEYDANTEAALAAKVFGVPWLVVDDVPYWGQDRYDFIQAALSTA